MDWIQKTTLGIALLFTFVAGAQSEIHTWTSRDGKTAQAEFVALEGETLILKRGSKELRVPLSGFSDADQAYARECVNKAQEKDRQQRQAQTERAIALRGLRKNVPITERRWESWKEYFTESTSGTDMLNFFKKERSIVDVSDRGVFVSPEDAVRPANYDPTMIVYCPEDYDGEEKLGVYIHISPGDRVAGPGPDYCRIMDKFRLVYASPALTGNKEADMRRCALTVDALAQLRKDYNIDEDRIYVGGTSGGGAIATFITFIYPQDFRAAINSVRSFSLTSSGCLPFASKSDIRKVGKYQQPYAFVSGPKDSGYNSIRKSADGFREHHFVSRFFDVPGMKHQRAPPDTFEQVLKWVESNNPKLTQ